MSVSNENRTANDLPIDAQNGFRLLALLALLIGLLALSPSLRAEDNNDFDFLIDAMRQKLDAAESKNSETAASTKPTATPAKFSSAQPTTTLRPVVSRTSLSLQKQNTARLRKSNQATKRNIGSAAILNGTVHVQHFFLSDKNSSWTEFEKDQVRRKLNEAYNFVQLQSRQYHKRIKFVDDFAKDIKFGGRIPRDAHADPQWTEYAIGLGADGSAKKAVARIKRETNADHVIICLHVNKAALSYNLAFYKNVTRCYEAERMICFSSYPDGRETSAATYAHEILHLFGAGDLYFPYDQTPDRKNEAAQLFPNDVMYRVDYDIFQLNVGEFTAYRVGWQDSLRPEFLHLED